MDQVASFTDAWIETINQNRFIVCISVASFTDAWIETCYKQDDRYWQMSHLLQMRGLKQWLRKREKDKQVASFTDAWIETTYLLAQEELLQESHLLQMRGLKHA